MCTVAFCCLKTYSADFPAFLSSYEVKSAGNGNDIRFRGIVGVNQLIQSDFAIERILVIVYEVRYLFIFNLSPAVSHKVLCGGAGFY